MTYTRTLTSTPAGPLKIGASPIVDRGNVQFSLVIPTYNESQNIGNLLAQLTQQLEAQLPKGYELILVDDDSPDQTWKAAQSLMDQYPQLLVMRRVGERGLSSAVIRGWQVARGDILGVIDADLQHPPETLTDLLRQMQAGADLAVASRHVDGGGVSDWSAVRRFLSRGAQVLGLLILPAVVGRVSDPMSGYFMVRRQAIAGPRLNPVGYKILLEVLGRGRIGSIAETGYVFQEREEGESKVTWKQYVAYLGHLARLRLDRPIQKPFRHPQKFMRQAIRQFPFKRFLRFGLVGFSGVFVNMAVLYALREGLHLGLTTSLVCAAELAIVNNFLWNDAWTFADISQRQVGWRSRLKRFYKFNLICLAGLVLNVLIVNLLFNIFSLNEYWSNLIAIALVTAWNFWLNLKLSWRVTQVKK